jgi:hypothetical protein
MDDDNSWDILKITIENIELTEESLLKENCWFFDIMRCM